MRYIFLQHSKERKQAFYSGLLQYAANKGFKQGWASVQYRERYTVWPNAMEKRKGEINGETNDFITSKNIAYANGKGRQRNTEETAKNRTETASKHDIRHDVPVDGYVYTKQTASNGMLQVKATLNGKYKFFATQTPEIMAIALNQQD